MKYLGKRRSLLLRQLLVECSLVPGLLFEETFHGADQGNSAHLGTAGIMCGSFSLVLAAGFSGPGLRAGLRQLNVLGSFL